MCKTEIESDFLETLLETGEKVLEISEDEGGDFVECSFDGDWVALVCRVKEGIREVEVGED